MSPSSRASPRRSPASKTTGRYRLGPDAAPLGRAVRSARHARGTTIRGALRRRCSGVHHRDLYARPYRAQLELADLLPACHGPAPEPPRSGVAQLRAERLRIVYEPDGADAGPALSPALCWHNEF